MKIVEWIDVFNEGMIEKDANLLQSWTEVKTALLGVDWPHGSGFFTINPSKKENGVKPIKIPCMQHLQNMGWTVEGLPHLPSTALKTGDLDALKETSKGYVIFEWETGNISSSHRAINKLMLALQEDAVVCGYLVVPSNILKLYLTDRIGNIGELRPYFKLWKTIPGIKGTLRIVVVEHDATDPSAPIIPKGQDGNAKKPK